MLGHFIFKLPYDAQYIPISVFSLAGSVLLVLTDSVVEIITATFLWTNVASQASWSYEKCTELPMYEAGYGPKVELLVTHCSHVSMKTDRAAAIVASVGAMLAVSLLALEMRVMNRFHRKHKILTEENEDSTIALQENFILFD